MNESLCIASNLNADLNTEKNSDSKSLKYLAVLINKNDALASLTS